MRKYLVAILVSGSVLLSPSVNACEKLSTEMVKTIASALSISGGGDLEVSTARAVKSKDFDNVYFIAAEIQGMGMEGNGEIGLWSSNSLQAGKGMLFSVNSLAVEFSTYPDGRRSKAHLSQYDHGGQEAIQCVKEAEATK